MRACTIKALALLPILAIAFLFVQAQSSLNKLIFKTSTGKVIKITPESIICEDVPCFSIRNKDIIIISKRNRLLESQGSCLLFLEENGSPNFNRLLVFNVSGKNVRQVADAVSSDLKDLDGDGNLEFGGADLTEIHPSSDSMYYRPSKFYEINNGMVVFDSNLTRQTEINNNGIYLSKPLDRKGNCCLVIKKQMKAFTGSIALINPDIISERINGPANLRDSINGKIILSLEDNIAVSSYPISKHWYKIGFEADISPTQYNTRIIPKGAALYIHGKKIATVLQPLNLKKEELHQENGKIRLFIIGYTAIDNIKSTTQPENALNALLVQASAKSFSSFADFIKGYQLVKTKIGDFECYQLDYGIAGGPSSPVRLLLVFSQNSLMGIVHAAAIDYKWSRSIDVYKQNDYALIFSILDQPSTNLINNFLEQFKHLMNQAG